MLDRRSTDEFPFRALMRWSPRPIGRNAQHLAAIAKR